MKTKLITGAILCGILMSACANTGAGYHPITDGPLNASFHSDLNSCQQLATKRQYINGDTKTKAVIGAGLGMLAGLADDDVSDSEGAIAGAIVGALAGGGSEMLNTSEQRRQIVISCMKGRGHPVIG